MSLLGRLHRKLSRPIVPDDRFSGTFPFFNVLELVLKHAADIDRIEFLQIGAADGLSEDPISELVRKHGWRGLLVEPSPAAFKKLVANYEGISGLSFENCLISDQSGQPDLTFFQLKEPYRNSSIWAEQCSSLHRKVVMDSLYYLSSAYPDAGFPIRLEDALEEVSLPNLHVSELLRNRNIDRLDLVVIDTMGYDAKIIQSFPFAEIKPTVIMFEHFLLSNRDKQSLLRFLSDQGYAFIKYAVDTIAVRSETSRTWPVDEW